MEPIEKSIDVDAPIQSVYNQWTQFEDFPHFMNGVKEVIQKDATHLHWRVNLWGKEEEWDAVITEQEPDIRVSWKSIDGLRTAGTVRFYDLGNNRTQVRLAMSYQPADAIEKVGDALGIVDRNVESSLKDFKKYIEQRGVESGAWRGEVHDSRMRPRS
jgi:uncharacterized membrane protein